MAQSEYLRLERGLRPKQPEEHPPDQVEQVLHRAFIARFGPSRQAHGIYDSDNEALGFDPDSENPTFLKPAVEGCEGRALGCAATQYIQLVPKRDYLSLERTPRPEEVQEDPSGCLFIRSFDCAKTQSFPLFSARAAVRV